MALVGKTIQAVDPLSGCWLRGTVRDQNEYQCLVKWTGYSAKHWVETTLVREPILRRERCAVDKSNFPIFKAPQNLQAGDQVCHLNGEKGKTQTISTNDKFMCEVKTSDGEVIPYEHLAEVDILETWNTDNLVLAHDDVAELTAEVELAHDIVLAHDVAELPTGANVVAQDVAGPSVEKHDVAGPSLLEEIVAHDVTGPSLLEEVAQDVTGLSLLEEILAQNVAGPSLLEETVANDVTGPLDDDLIVENVFAAGLKRTHACDSCHNYKKMLLEVGVIKNEQTKTNNMLAELLAAIKTNAVIELEQGNLDHTPVNHMPIEPVMLLDDAGFVKIGGDKVSGVPVTMAKETYASLVKANQKPSLLIKALMDCLFNRHEMSRSNFNGAQNKDPLDQRKVKALLGQIMIQFKDTGIILDEKQLRNAINEKCRYYRRLEKESSSSENEVSIVMP